MEGGGGRKEELKRKRCKEGGRKKRRDGAKPVLALSYGNYTTQFETYQLNVSVPTPPRSVKWESTPL